MQRLPLIALFVYTAAAKLLSFNDFKAAMLLQPLPHPVVVLLMYTLPAMESLAAIQLLFNNTLRGGYVLSIVLLAAFTAYAALAWADLLPAAACPCGGLISHVPWPAHFLINLSFLALAVWGLDRARRKPVQRVGDTIKQIV